MVHEVIGHALVVPAQPARRGIKVHFAIGIELRARLANRLCGRMIGIADAERHRAVAADQRGLPRAACAETTGAAVQEGIEPPQHLAGGGLQRQQHPAAGPGPDGACQVDAAVGHLGLDAERPLALTEQIPVDPDRLAGAGAEREHGGHRVAVDDTARDRDAVRTALDYLRRADLVLPLQLPGRQSKRIDVVAEILHIGDPVRHDRRRCHRAEARSRRYLSGGQLECPRLLQARDIGRRDRRAGRIPRVLRIAIRIRPRAGGLRRTRVGHRRRRAGAGAGASAGGHGHTDSQERCGP